MRKLIATGSLVLLVLACAPEVKSVAPPAVVTARFDPSRTPPVVPTPTDLATDPTTGLLNITPAPDASEADKALIAYLNTLNGFPASSTAVATFTTPLAADSVKPTSVRVFDISADYAEVEGVQVTYMDQPEDPEAKGRLTIKGPGGAWLPGHTYAFALIGGEDGLKGAEGQPLVGSAAWMLLRSEKSLTTCEDLTSPDCRSTTDILPSKEEDPAKRREDQARTAVRLEAIRRQYKPSIEHLLSQGVKREHIALLWSFKVADLPQVVFNPAVTPARVPVPNDLAIDRTTGLVNAPINPAASPAEQEFTRDYLNTLTAFPTSSTAAVEIAGGDLDPATVTRETVRLVQVAGTPAGDGFKPTLAYDEQKKRIALTPPATGWPKGTTWAVTVVAGAEKGVRMRDGKVPVGSEVWALLRTKAPLVTCEDLTASDCAGTVKLSPVSTADALRLEAIRRQYAPLLDTLESQGIPRDSVAVLWTFSIVPNAEATFDPANRVVPFFNDLVRVPATDSSPARVNLPIADDATEQARQLITNLNTLDGFSTTGTLVSENGEARAALDTGAVKQETLATGAGFFRLSPTGAEPQVRICLDCDSRPSTSPEAPANPQQLQFVPQLPLDPLTSYGGYLTTDLQDTRGLPVIATPAFALMRSSHPLVDAAGKSTVSLITDEQARQLEPARLTLKPMMDALAARGIPRGKVALAFSFTTQSTRPLVDALAALPEQMKATLPATVKYVSTTLTTFVKDSNNNPYPYDRLGNVYMGRLSLPDALTGAGGRLKLSAPRAVEVPFLLTVPSGAVPTDGFPVVIWGHPLTGTRMTALAIANAFATQGMALLAVDLPHHGDRASCVGSKDSLALQGATSDDAACETTAMTCNASTGRCVAKDPNSRTVCKLSALSQPDDALCFIAGQGLCLPDAGVCEGGTFKEDANTTLPLISGWDYIGSDFFANRDRMLQSVAELAQLVRIIGTTGTGSLNAAVGNSLNPNSIHYAGMSLGGMVGALSASASPKVHRVLLNASGADLPSILLDGLTPAARASFLEKLAAAGIHHGTPAFDQFINILRMVMDPADAANHAPALLSGPSVPTDRQVFIQYVEGDPVIPNANTLRIVSSVNRAGSEKQALVVPYSAPATVSGSDRHAFLLTGASSKVTNADHKSLTTKAQQEAARFLKTGSHQ